MTQALQQHSWSLESENCQVGVWGVAGQAEEGGALQRRIFQPVRTWVRPGHRPVQAKDRKQVALLRPRQGGVLGGPCLGMGVHQKRWVTLS